jgi:ribosome-associated protein
MQNELLPALAVTALEDLKGTDIQVIDVTELTNITDHMVVCTGRSSRHVKALGMSVAEKAKAAKLDVISISGTEKAEWVLVDLGDAVIHVMLDSVRELYDLESLWTGSVTPADHNNRAD